MSNLIAVAYDDVDTARNMLRTLNELSVEHARSVRRAARRGAGSSACCFSRRSWAWRSAPRPEALPGRCPTWEWTTRS